MSTDPALGLHDPEVAKDFYEQRYADGYMEDWPASKKARVLGLLRELNLPEEGEALDYGCGNGVFTEVLRKALPPAWRIYGTDISREAIKNAERRVSGCHFSLADDKSVEGKRFDFVFTHHVLEHVQNLNQNGHEIAQYVKPGGSMLHILPCGNAGSYEHGLCSARTDGINKALEDRFFFEDEGHVRRLTTARIEELFSREGLKLRQGWYSNQYAGAVEWITRSGPGFVLKLTDATHAKDASAGKHLRRQRLRLMTWWALRYPAVVVDSRLERKKWRAKDVVALVVGGVFYLISKPVDLWLTSLANAEWKKQRGELAGSEMYVHFVRD